MAYLYERFGATYAAGEVLPLFDGTEPMGSGPVPDPVIQLPGGGFWDTLQSGNAKQGSRAITLKGDWIAASAAAMDTKIDALTALVGKRSYLWKSNDGGTTTRHILARCLAVRTPTGPGSALMSAVEMDFVLEAELWSGAAHTETTVIDAASHAVASTNGGNEIVRDAVITVTAKVATITLVSFYVAGILHWHYTGTIGINQSLVVSCGPRSVLNNGVDDFAHFVLQADHATADWVPLAAGLNTITVETTSTDHTAHEVLVVYADGWM